MATKKQIDALAERTADAYSSDRYRTKGWRACAALLLGPWAMSEREAEAVLRSKWMRWAGDMANDPRRPTSKDLDRYLRAEKKRLGMGKLRDQVRELVAGTFELQEEQSR